MIFYFQGTRKMCVNHDWVRFGRGLAERVFCRQFGGCSGVVSTQDPPPLSALRRNGPFRNVKVVFFSKDSRSAEMSKSNIQTASSSIKTIHLHGQNKFISYDWCGCILCGFKTVTGSREFDPCYWISTEIEIVTELVTEPWDRLNSENAKR